MLLVGWKEPFTRARLGKRGVSIGHAGLLRLPAQPAIKADIFAGRRRGHEHFVEMLLDQAVPAHVGTDKGRIDVDHITDGQASRQAVTVRWKIWRNRSGPQRCRILVRLE